MLDLRPADQRGHADYGWLRTFHSFSFNDYYDPRHVQFRALRVLNEDFVAPGSGFPAHPHREMEIVTLVLQGALAHRDSMGNGSVVHPGEVQRMSAGTGVTHSEFNPSDREPTHLLQIWLLPARQGLTPSYEQRRIADAAGAGTWVTLAAPESTAPAADGEASGPVLLHQDARLLLTRLEAGGEVPLALAPERYGYLHVIDGEVDVVTEAGESVHAGAGDAVKIAGESARARAIAPARLLLFDLA